VELSGSRFAETNRVYQIDYKIPEKLLKNKRNIKIKINKIQFWQFPLFF